MQDLVWVVVYSSTGDWIGDQVDPAADPSGMTKVGSMCCHLFAKGGSVLLARGVSSEGAHLSDLVKSAAAARIRRARTKTSASFQSCMMLRKNVGGRWRRQWRKSRRLISMTSLWLEGTVFRDMKQLRRLGFDWVQHHESWICKSGVRATDRSVHEHMSTASSVAS